jgi:hypothetical protein
VKLSSTSPSGSPNTVPPPSLFVIAVVGSTPPSLKRVIFPTGVADTETFASGFPAASKVKNITTPV